MVGLAQGGHHLSFDEVLAAEAASTVQTLVIQRAHVLALSQEEASIGQFASAH